MRVFITSTEGASLNEIEEVTSLANLNPGTKIIIFVQQDGSSVAFDTICLKNGVAPWRDVSDDLVKELLNATS